MDRDTGPVDGNTPGAENENVNDGRRRILFALVPLLVFLVVAGFFGYQLKFGTDARIIPSALIDKPVPQVSLPSLKEGKPGFGPEDFGGKPVLVNVFASWCGPCRIEHPYITRLAQRDDILVFGLNTKDSRDDAIGWLNDLGDPYDRIGFDPDGRAAIEWGVYGYPETFLVSPEGKIVYKFVGPIHPKLIQEEFLPRIEAMLK